MREAFVLGVLPLDIVGLPEYEKLSEPERDLCTELRLLKWIMRFYNIGQIPPIYHEGNNKLRLLPSVFAELRAKLQVGSQIFQLASTFSLLIL